MTPTFALTFDTELIWGSLHRMGPGEFAARHPDVRWTIRPIIGLLDAYQIPATWAFVGHLLLSRCERTADGRANHGLVAPPSDAASSPFFAADPCSDRQRDPLFYGDDILDAVLAAKSRHEIGCHSFMHAPLNDPALNHEMIRADLQACRRAAAERGIELQSFVFPWNRIAHLPLLQEQGFVAFRGPDPTWHAGIGGLPGRAAHLLDQAAAVTPPVVVPREELPGLWNIPGSMLLMPPRGIRSAVPARSRVAKAEAGLRAAIRRGAVFHLWAHPWNLANEAQFMLGVLERILERAATLRQQGLLVIEPMAAIAARGREGERSVS